MRDESLFAKTTNAPGKMIMQEIMLSILLLKNQPHPAWCCCHVKNVDLLGNSAEKSLIIILNIVIMPEIREGSSVKNWKHFIRRLMICIWVYV